MAYTPVIQTSVNLSNFNLHFSQLISSIWFRRLRRREKSRIFVDCKLAAPLGFCRGCGPRFRVHLSRHACSLLICGFFPCFRLFGVFFEANWFLTLIAFDKKDNAVPMQPGVRVFGRAKTNYIIAKHVYTRRFLRYCSFLEVFYILDRAGPVWSGCEMTCFCYIVGTTLFILLTNTTLNRLGFGMLAVRVGTAIFHWL